MNDQQETLVDYFDRTKGEKQRSLRILGHHSPTASASDAAEGDERRSGANSEELAPEPGRPE